MKVGFWRRLLCPAKLMVFLLLVLLAERVALFWQFGVDYLSYSDDHAYLAAGLLFARTGMISMWGPYPSAMIMPGMPVLIGAFSRVFAAHPIEYVIAEKSDISPIEDERMFTVRF